MSLPDQPNSSSDLNNLINVNMLDDIVNTQKKYFLMYINNKSAELAVNLENDVKAIIAKCVNDEINAIIDKKVEKLLSHINNTFESKIKANKLNLFEYELDKLQLKIYEDLTDYVDNVLQTKMETYINDMINKKFLIKSEDEENEDIKQENEAQSEDGLNASELEEPRLEDLPESIVIEINDSKEHTINQIETALQKLDQFNNHIANIKNSRHQFANNIDAIVLTYRFSKYYAIVITTMVAIIFMIPFV